MKNVRLKLFFSSLYWKISSVFLFILGILAVFYILIAVHTAEMYFQEVSQRLNSSAASHVVDEIVPFLNGQVNNQAMEKVFHNVMVTNPSLEVYLLDSLGNILLYYAPNKTVRLNKVSLTPIFDFIDHNGQKFVLGDDPKKPGIQKAFSAASITNNGHTDGYLYIILGGEEFESTTSAIFGSYILRLSAQTMGITLIAAAVIGLFAFGYLTRNLRTVMRNLDAFKSGKLDVRMSPMKSDELSQVAQAFNDMAGTIQRQMEEISNADALRRELVANVSHDLRTPLSGIHGYLETILMKDEELSADKRKKYIALTLQNTERLEKLVEELFELSKLEAKQTLPKMEPFSIAELVQDAIQKYNVLAVRSGIAINAKLPENLPLIYADIAMIDRVIQNLVDNAIKFTPEGGRVSIELSQIEGTTIDLKISDTGRGIPADELSVVFDRYYRSSHRSEGMGLGLAIVKKILEVHGIDISVESEVDKGTIFSFQLPIYRKAS